MTDALAIVGVLLKPSLLNRCPFLSFYLCHEDKYSQDRDTAAAA